MDAMPCGMLVVDKPSGPTSHDVVSRVRRALGTRSVGHAGTLDPMASGVLLVMVGECTKLARFLTLEDKSYEARVRLGVGTDTLDALGQQTACMEPDVDLLEEIASMSRGQPGQRISAAMDRERARTDQVPPAFSALKQGGIRAYALARRGVELEMPPRRVEVMDLVSTSAWPETRELGFRMRVSKGYYVRAFARDLGLALGIPAHLTALRRISTGQWGIDQAVDLSAIARGASLIPTADVARACMPRATLTAAGVHRAVCGQALGDEDFCEPPPAGGASAWFDEAGLLVAVGERMDGRPVVLRGFVHQVR